MIKTDESNNILLQYEVVGRISRIPLERMGTSKSGKPWFLGSVLLEVYEEGVEGSVRLFLITWSEEMYETVYRMGVGKNVRVKFHIQTKERFDSYDVSAILDEISMLTEAENFLVGKESRQ